MDFNDIQSAWNNDNSDKVVLPNRLEKLQSANMPLDKIRKNLKNEFIYQFISIVSLGLIPVMCKFSTLMSATFYGLFALFLVICLYFLVKLYMFYKRLNTVETNTKDNLYETYYDIRLNMELYKSYTYSLMPFALIFVGMIHLSSHMVEIKDFILNQESANFFLWIMLTSFVSMMVTIAFVTEWWVNHFYGKYAKEIRKVLDELKEE
jgi:RNAse (barnase) inhibitor barstar